MACSLCLIVNLEDAFGTVMRQEYVHQLLQKRFLQQEVRKMFMKHQEAVEESTLQF